MKPEPCNDIYSSKQNREEKKRKLHELTCTSQSTSRFFYAKIAAFDYNTVLYVVSFVIILSLYDFILSQFTYSLFSSWLNTVMGLFYICLLLASAKVMDCGNSEAIDQLSLKETQRAYGLQRQIIKMSDPMLSSDTLPQGRHRHRSSWVFSSSAQFSIMSLKVLQ